MSEQKYYVKLNMLKGSIHKRENGYNKNYHPDYVYFLCEDGKSIAPCFESITEWTETHAEANDFHLGKFTKSELAKIMNGAFYKVKQKPKNITIDQLISDGWDRLIGNTWEWINQLIELVPVITEDVTDV